MPEHVGAVPGLVCPAIVAHRGASARHPENTLVAFEAAIMAGADMIELDVRLTADGVPVVLHDQDVAVTTDGSGLVSDLTLAQVKSLHAGTARQRREGVPTLREALALLRGRAGVEIDIKIDPGEPGFDGPRQPLAEQVLELLDALRFGSAIVTSENPQTVEWVKRHAPLIATGIEIEESADLEELLAYSAARGYAFVLPSADAVLDAGRQFVDHAHALGLQLDVWTVDDPRLMTELLAWGVDLIETNDPDLAVPIRDRVRRTRDLPARGC